jgi:hypothetical protein
MKMDEKLLKRFFDKVNKTPTCWLWTGAKACGYGQIGLDGKLEFSHRLSYEHFVGEIPPTLCVLHECDNPSCVNPGHLFLGTKKNNTSDMIRKSRDNFNFKNNLTRGAKNTNVVLSEEQVLEIKRLLQDPLHVCLEIANRFKVSPSTINQIKKGDTWNWLKP